MSDFAKKIETYIRNVSYDFDQLKNTIRNILVYNFIIFFSRVIYSSNFYDFI